MNTPKYQSLIPDHSSNMKTQLCIVLALAAVCLAAEEGKTQDKRQVLGLATVPAVFNPVASYVAPRLPYAALPYNVAAAYPTYNTAYNGNYLAHNAYNGNYLANTAYNGNYLANNAYPYAGLPYNAVQYSGYPYGVGRAAYPGVGVSPAFAAAPISASLNAF